MANRHFLIHGVQHTVCNDWFLGIQKGACRVHFRIGFSRIADVSHKSNKVDLSRTGC